MKRKLVLQNGEEFVGNGFGAINESICELVFNTSMSGYQEILSDPSYTDQMVVMTYPLIGNYGITDEDFESRIIAPGGLIVREYNDKPSNFRYTKTCADVLEENGIPGICNIDTRKLTRILRDQGSQLAIICDASLTKEEALAKIASYDVPCNQVKKVTSKKIWYSRTPNPKYNVVAIDCGIKYNIIRKLNQYGCNVTIVPMDTTAEVILGMKPDGVFLSNGPGDPEDVKEVIELVRQIQGKVAMFGICLGHQMIALANGLQTYKMKFGHRGANHPVKSLKSGKIEITSQNHSYSVKSENIPSHVSVTHVNLLDQSVEGIEIKEDYLFSVQYHPESAPGPQDSEYLFEEFVANMNAFKEEVRNAKA